MNIKELMGTVKDEETLEYALQISYNEGYKDAMKDCLDKLRGQKGAGNTFPPPVTL